MSSNAISIVQKKFSFKAFDAVFGKIGRHASVEIEMFPSFFVWHVGDCPVNNTDTKSFDFALYCIYAKVLNFSKSSSLIIGVRLSISHLFQIQ